MESFLSAASGLSTQPLGHLCHPHTLAAAITHLLNPGASMLQRMGTQASPVLQVMTTVMFPCTVGKRQLWHMRTAYGLRHWSNSVTQTRSTDPSSVTQWLHGLRQVTERL